MEISKNARLMLARQADTMRTGGEASRKNVARFIELGELQEAADLQEIIDYNLEAAAVIEDAIGLGIPYSGPSYASLCAAALKGKAA